MKRPQIPLFDKCQSASESELDCSTAINEKVNTMDKIDKRIAMINSGCVNNKIPENITSKKDAHTSEMKKKLHKCQQRQC